MLGHLLLETGSASKQPEWSSQQQPGPLAEEQGYPFPQGIGGDATSPFSRHPCDVVLPADANKEYKNYTAYSTVAPVGRTTVPDIPSETVTPGTDVVTCLSCHVAHASQYPDLLRWNYDTMVASGGETGGCFTCHTGKN